MRKEKLPINRQAYAAEIIKCLDRLSAAGHSRSTVFEDFLKLAEASLEALPRHVISISENGQYAEDTEETKELFSPLRSRYGRGNPERFKRYMGIFSEAIGILILSAETGEANHEYMDIPGDIYMQLEIGNLRNGQFFTPMNVAKCMAEMTMMDMESQVYERIKQALLHPDNIYGHAVLLTSVILEKGDAQKYFFETVLPAAVPYYDPIRVCDPCVGSGVMLLAVACTAPAWMTKWGLIRFYGSDIDNTCVRMCRINIMLYGLNGTHIAYYRDLPPQIIAAMPEPYAELYKKAQAEPEKILEVTEEFKHLRQLTFQL